MPREGKYPTGSEHPQAKLNERVVQFIRASDETIGLLARRFNVPKIAPSLTDEPLYQIDHQKQDHRPQGRRDNSADNASAQG